MLVKGGPGVSHKVPSKSPVLCSPEPQSYSGTTWVSVEDERTDRRLGPSPYHEAKEFSVDTKDQEVADQAS